MISFFLCGTSIPCKDLEDEVNLDIFWKRIVDHNKTRKECNEIFGEVNVTKFTCPFSSRIDLQFYAFIISGKKPEFRKNINESELCVDRYGRKYPPPQGLGGKCVMFQHEFEENGIPKTEFFMPIEKRDLIQRISQYPLTHALRQNETTLNRFLPREYVVSLI
uniref:Uncharacterized protein n=1 Tax=Panagrolaimus superbus TaxID=310955 RepID=A0A914YHQ8_9BILA